MKSNSNSDHVARAMNFKRPCWLTLFASVGAMLAGGSAYWIFPAEELTSAPPLWQTATESALFLLMVVGIFGFVASLLWWCAAAIKFRHLSSRSRPTAALATFSGLGLVAALCLLGGNLQAQDDNVGGPGGPPPDQLGDGGPGGPPPGDLGGGGPGGPGDFNRSGGPGGGFDPAQFEQRMLDQTRKNLNVTNDDEWAAIQPLVKKIMDARREARSGGGMGMFGPPPGGPGGRSGASAQVSSEQEALQKTIEADAPVPQIKDALAKCRAAHQDKQTKLEAAQDNLKNVLSVKQEAEAVLMGLLP